MTIKKSEAVKFLEKITGGPLTIADIIQSNRLAEEETQASFAKKLDISVSHLSDIENGRKGVSPERAIRFAQILGLSESLFLEIALEDLLKRSGINYHVQVKKFEPKTKRFRKSKSKL